jgi:hypothetical protein
MNRWSQTKRNNNRWSDSIDHRWSTLSFGSAPHFPWSIDATASHRPNTPMTDLCTTPKSTNLTIDHQQLVISDDYRINFPKSVDLTIDHFCWLTWKLLTWHDTWMMTSSSSFPHQPSTDSLGWPELFVESVDAQPSVRLLSMTSLSWFKTLHWIQWTLNHQPIGNWKHFDGFSQPPIVGHRRS